MANLFDDEDRLSKLKIELEVEKQLQVRLDDILKSPDKLQSLLIERNKQIADMTPKVDAYHRFIDADGEVSCDAVADSVILFYSPERGKHKKRMGRNYMIQVLKHDRIIFEDRNGFKLYAAYKEYGRTQTSEKNGFIKTSVKFSAKGIAYLEKKYNEDNRTWKVENGKLTY